MIFTQITEQLQHLSNLLLKISNEQYTRKIVHLDGATIGGHSRHIIELIKIVTEGYETGEIDYINRKRNLLLETDRLFAIDALQQIQNIIVLPNKPLLILAEPFAGEGTLKTQTSYFREIIYGTEHTIHHFALLKVALFELNVSIGDPHFGMAYSTIRYRANLLEETGVNKG